MSRLMIWTASLGLVIGASFHTSRPAWAWGHGCHGHHSHFSSGWGGYGMGGGFRGFGCTNFRASFCPPTLSFASTCLPFRSCYSPCAAFYPTCLSYRSAFHCGLPSYGYVGCYNAPFSFTSVNFSAYAPWRGPGVFYQPIIYRPVFVSKSNTALQLIDAMIAQGGFEEGLESCERLIAVSSHPPREVYIRAALLAAVTQRDPHEIVGWLDKATLAGIPLNGEELPGGSVRAYLSAANQATFDQALNRLAESALKKTQPIAEYQAISVLLALDGQINRAELFAKAANSEASKPEATEIAGMSKKMR